MPKPLYTLALLFLANCLFSQAVPTPAAERIQSFEKRKLLRENSLVAKVPFQSIGPTVFSGRVADIDVSPVDPTHFYVAYASGGLWKTENNGQSFTPIFDREMVMTIGDIAVDWQRNTIWVGTGEVNASRSSYSGVGMFKSSDGGKTWQHKGLGESHHIGRVVLHPSDTNTLWVAVLGHLYSSNEERGVFKSTDGGNTWRKVLYVDENTGAVDLSLDAADGNTLYAATWHRERRAWDFVEAGEGSGIYKSTDGGEHWALLSKEGSGFPTGKNVGRIGLANVRQNGSTALYAIVDNQNRRPKEEKEEEEGLTKEKLRLMGKEDFLLVEIDLLKQYLEDNDFPEKYDAEKIIDLVRSGQILPQTLAEYLDNANNNLFDTPVVGAEVYRSLDGGKSWNRTHDDFLDNLYYSYGYYFGQIRVANDNPDQLYIFGVPVLKSSDGGRNWTSINGDNVHVDHHALWINPARKGHLILGNDGGINISYDDGENWIKCNTPPVGQFYYVAVDMQEPFNVYGGLQDNGVWYGPSTYEASNHWHNTGHYPYTSLLGGDGMQVAIDSRDNNTVYTGFQFGYYYKIDRQAKKSQRITPKHDLGEKALRWNWQTPIHLSEHNQDILYIGANKVFRSFNQGKDWTAISADLTKGAKEGDVPYGTLSALHESPLKFGLLYAGSDDGLLHVSRDGGTSWKNISQGLSQDFWISRVQASRHVEGRVYVSLNGYRWDNFSPQLFVSEDEGETWARIGDDLPLEPINVIKEDPENENLLYVGTDHGLYVSLDRGRHFMLMDKDLPAVAVHDVVVHPRDKQLLVGTHGRSLFLADVSPVQQLRDSILQKELYVFELPKTSFRRSWGNPSSPYSSKTNEPDIALPVFSKKSGKVKISVKAGDLLLWQWEENLDKGLNYPVYHATVREKAAAGLEEYLNKTAKKTTQKTKLKAAKNGKYYLQKGSYDLLFEMDGLKIKKQLVVK